MLPLVRSATALTALGLCLVTACTPSEQGAAPTPEGPHLKVTDSDGGVQRAVVDVVIDCRAKTKPISPDIYGVGYDLTGYSDANDARQWLMNPGARRFGGNASTRYNWELGTFNHGSDWVFANNATPKGEPLYTKFLREDDAKGVTSAITIPIIGWVAKDGTSSSFPLSKYPSQLTPDTARGAGRRQVAEREAHRVPRADRDERRGDAGHGGALGQSDRDRVAGRQAHLHPRQRAGGSGTRPTATSTRNR